MCCFYHQNDLKTSDSYSYPCIRPHLEYTAPVWSMHLQNNIAALERLTQQFTSKMHTKNWDTGYNRLLDMLELLSLHSHNVDCTQGYTSCIRFLMACCNIVVPSSPTSSFANRLHDLIFILT